MAALMSQNDVTKYFQKSKVQCQLIHIAAWFDQHGNCATVTVKQDIVEGVVDVLWPVM